MGYETGINEAYQNLNKNAQDIYEFIILYSNYIYAKHKYGTETKFNMMEIHILTHIEDNPGVTITEIARIWKKTTSAISQIIKRFVDEGYVEKRFKENNNKSILLFVTEAGKQLSYVHKAYDVADITQTSSYLESRCGNADIEAFYRVLHAYTDLLKENKF